MTTKSKIWMSAVASLVLAVPAMAGGPYVYHTVTPCRTVDTRPCTATPAPTCGSGAFHGVQNFTIKGKCGIPDGTLGSPLPVAVTINATVVSPGNTGYLSLWPSDGSEPLVSTLNYVLGDSAIANGAIVPLGAPLTLDLATRMAVGAPNAQLVIDVTGYFATN